MRVACGSTLGRGGCYCKQTRSENMWNMDEVLQAAALPRGETPVKQAASGQSPNNGRVKRPAALQLPV
jgi:hypothetical protein